MSQIITMNTWNNLKKLQEIDKGSFGFVFLAEDTQTKKRYAVKKILIIDEEDQKQEI